MRALIPFLLVVMLACVNRAPGTNPTPEDKTVTDDRSAERTQLVRALAADTGWRRGIRDKRVLDAVGAVPRHRFVPARVAGDAYLDQPLPIGHGQTISQPWIVARMTELLQPKPDDVVLEVGTGSGYQAAVLSPLVKHVYTIEIVEPLATRAAADLKAAGYANVTVRAGDGYKGWPEHAPFAGIIVTAAPDHVPQPLIDQLAEGGRLVLPVGPAWGVQELRTYVKKDGALALIDTLPVRFVPLTGEHGAD